ncbi:hypothetical protein, partial [Helicobacter sp. T3_23-1056]
MDKINELQDNIQNLQIQINATQAQINDYKTNPKYYDYLTYCGGCYAPLDSCTYFDSQNCGNPDMFYKVE